METRTHEDWLSEIMSAFRSALQQTVSLNVDEHKPRVSRAITLGVEAALSVRQIDITDDEQRAFVSWAVLEYWTRTRYTTSEFHDEPLVHFTAGYMIAHERLYLADRRTYRIVLEQIDINVGNKLACLRSSARPPRPLAR